MRALLCLLLLTFALDLNAGTSTAIRVDQVGYRTAETKYAMVVSGAATGAFNLRRSSDNVSVLAGTLAAAFTDTASGDSIRTADFSAYNTPGTYYLDVAGVGQSYPFQIGEGIYNDAYYLALRSFYAQRCGTAVDLGVFDGVDYQYPVCHSSGATTDLGSTYHPSSGRTGTRNTGKGWHDAGDYGKYIVNSGITTGQILWTYEWWNDRIGAINMNIPESGNGTPDILDEARWNLEWMLTMQDSDGGVWHKNTSAGFGGYTLPHLDNAGTRYVIGTGSGAPNKSSCATADFAAVMAIAARLFQPYDAAFAATCLAAAQSAYTWVVANPTVYYTQPTAPGMPPTIVTGAYGDGNCSDELLWAAAELFRTTGNATYNNYVTTNTPGGTLFSGTAYPQDWANVRNMALWAYYFSGQATANAALRTRIYNDTLAAATVIANRTNGATNGYKVSLVPPGHYVWGSNGGVANFGVFLLVADRMSPSANYTNAALNNLHYLLGRNANNVSYLTHVGSNPFQRPHHRPSASPQYTAGPPWPGFLSGGPSNANDPAISGSPQASGPIAKRWIDDTGSYATNENAINWNAPLVFLLAWTVPPPVAGTPTHTPTVTPSPTPLACGPVNNIRRVNVGGTAFAGAQAWSADQLYSAGGWGYVAAGTTSTTTDPIAATTDDGLYQAQRWAANLQYRFTVPNGAYQVTVKLAETYWTANAARVFNILAEGATVLSGMDIHAAAPGHDRAYDVSFIVGVNDGILDLAFTASTDNATVAGISVDTASSGPCATNTFTPTGSPTRSATRTATLTASPTFSWTPSATPSRTTTPSATTSASPTRTPSPSVTLTASPSRTATPMASDTASATVTPSFTASPIASDTVSSTHSPSATATPTGTASPTVTPSFTASPIASDTVSPLASDTVSPTRSPTPTQTATETVSPLPSVTATPSLSATQTVTPLPSGTATPPLTATETVTASAPSNGPLQVLEAVFHPHPVRGPQLNLRFKLDGPAERIRLRLYSPAMVLGADLEAASGYAAGWNQAHFAIPGLPAGLWFAVLQAQQGSRQSLRAPPLRLYKLP